MKIKRFEDLECWQEARSLTKTVYGYVKQPKFFKDFRLTGQITGASVSIMNNISEGFDAKSNNEFIRFLTYSRRSCSEVQNCLYVSLDQEYITEKQFEISYAHCEKVRKIVDGLLRYLRACKSTQNKPTGEPANRQTGQPANGPTGKPANGQTVQRANRPTEQCSP